MLALDGLDTPPAFADPGALVADVFAELRIPARVPISVANQNRVLANPGAYSGPWGDSPHDMRFTERAMDALATDSPYLEVVVQGPAQTAKSEVGNAWMYHTILHDAADILFVMPDREAVKKYVTTQLNKMLDANPLLRARQLSGASSDNINLKQFRGCDFFMLHPVGTTFRAQPFSRGRLDDYDEFDMDISDQGTALKLLYGRMGSFEMFGGQKIYVNSTPKLGDQKGIEALLPAGTNERWWVDCLQCGEPFELDTEHVLKFDNTGTAEEAEASAMVVGCSCGMPHKQREKRALMGTGRWVGRGQLAVPRSSNETGVEGELVVVRRLSQRWDGLMGMRSWASMARLRREAEIEFETKQDETDLKTHWQTVIGKNYVGREVGEPRVTEEVLVTRARASGYKLGEVPAGGVCLIAAVDQHANRFEVAVWAFGVGFRAWLIDRFAVLVIERDGRKAPLKPFKRPEDWAVLHKEVLSRSYPMADGRPGRMKILNTAVDTGGLDNATDNAFQWWHSMVAGDIGSGRAPVPDTALTLIKGGNKPDRPLLRTPEPDARRQVKGAPQALLYVPNVNRIKSIADTRLKIDDGGAGAIHFPSDTLPLKRGQQLGELVAAPWISEMRCETKVGEQWVREPHQANETWDLYVYAYTVILRMGGGDASMAWVPEWARPPKGAPAPMVVEPTMRDVESGAAEAAADAAPVVQAGGEQRTVVQGQRPRRGVRVIRSR